MGYYERNMPDETPVNAAFMDYFGQSCVVPLLHFPEEYRGQKEVRLACTQHAVSACQQRKITGEWVDFLRGENLGLETVMVSTRLNQAIFDALCCQDTITALWIKWCAVPDLSEIVRLKNLRTLYIGLGTSITDLTPLGELHNLEVLRLGNTEKVTDYSPLGKLEKLKTLEIEANDKLNCVSLRMQSDSFLRKLPQLELLNLVDVRVAERSFLCEENVEHIRSVRFMK